MTRDEAIKALIERDVQRWGEGERQASTEMRSKLSHGRALNTLAYYDVENIDEDLAKLAKSVMTPEDHRALRKGG